MKTVKLILVIVSIFFISSTQHSIAQTLPLDDFMPYEMPAPPMKASSNNEKSIKLTQLSVETNEIIDESAWFEDNELYIPRYDTPNGNFSIDGFMKPSSVIPTQSGALKMFGGVKSAEANCYFYGEDGLNIAFLLITDADDTEILHFLDFGSYLTAPAGGYNMSLQWAVVENNVLYVSNTHHGYASVTDGINAFITAIDLRTGQIIWRSDTLVANANNFAIIGDNIVCGYGFTAEPDYIYILNKYTGRKTGTIKVASAPDYFAVKDGKLYVRTYNRNYVFKIEHNR